MPCIHGCGIYEIDQRPRNLRRTYGVLGEIGAHRTMRLNSKPDRLKPVLLAGYLAKMSVVVACWINCSASSGSRKRSRTAFSAAFRTAATYPSLLP